MTAYIFNDGGREAAGFKGQCVSDCVARAIAIAAELPYREVYDALARGSASERRTKHGGIVSGRRSARNDIHTGRKWFKDYMHSIGFHFIATMGIGTGCKVHLCAEELPKGRLIVNVSKHMTAMIDGVVNDTFRDYQFDTGSQRGVELGGWQVSSRYPRQEVGKLRPESDPSKEDFFDTNGPQSNMPTDGVHGHILL